MSVIIEDGNVVIGANSYATVDELRSFCKLRYITIPDDEDKLTGSLVIAFEYLNGIPNFKGCPVSEEQSGSWPRKNAAPFLNNQIPQALKNAQMQLAVDCIDNKMTLDLNVTNYAIRAEKIGPLETTYAIGGTYSGKSTKPVVPEYTKAMKFLKPLLKRSEGLYVII